MPVDVVTGDVFDTATDFRVGGRRAFVWTRHYRSSLATVDRGNGWGHRRCLDWELVLDLDGMCLHHPEGELRFPHLWQEGETSRLEGWTLRRDTELSFELSRAGEPTRVFTRPDPKARS